MKETLNVINQLKSTTKTNEKLSILKQHKDNSELLDVLRYTYSDRQYGFSEKLLRQAMETYETKFILTWKSYKDMLDELASSNINDRLRELTYEFLSLYDEEERDLYINMICNDLKIGMNVKSINKAIPNLIPEFGVQLAESYFKQKEGFLNGKEFIASTKLDGCRLVAIKENDKVTFKSRQGKIMEGLIQLEKELEDIPNGIVLDGELILRNYNNLPSDELFRETMKVARKKGEKTDLEFHVFDCIDLDKFNRGYDETPCKERKDKASKLIQGKEWLKIVPALYVGNDTDMITKLLDNAIENNQEGVIVNIADAPYQCKRTKNILKVKAMTTIDLKVVGFEEGQGLLSNSLGCVIVDYKGNKVGVGSGWTIEQRQEIWNNQEKYLGRVLEVQFFEESTDSKTGLPSLRFPVAKCIREQGKEVSYN